MEILSEDQQQEIDAAIIDCLRIFAARGRALRQHRERLSKTPIPQKNAPDNSDSQDAEFTDGEQVQGEATHMQAPDAHG